MPASPSQLPPVLLPPNRIREMRQARGLRLVDLVAHFRKSESTIARWETSRTSPSDADKIRLAELLETTVPYLFGWTDDDGNGNGRAAA